jgi:hypothetical protein
MAKRWELDSKFGNFEGLIMPNGKTGTNCQGPWLGPENYL